MHPPAEPSLFLAVAILAENAIQFLLRRRILDEII